MSRDKSKNIGTKCLQSFHPLVSGWFAERFAEPTPAQVECWPKIQANKDVLLAAPTGSGKTLAAFLSAIDRLICEGARAPLPEETTVLYISPLKALSNDVRKNLEEPLAEIREYGLRQGEKVAEIRTGLRTGDTPPSERTKLVKHPPHILITTPESLYLMLTAAKSRETLRTIKTVIVDEIHALARDKRGSHLALTLARLDALRRESGDEVPRRIGLSATQRPIDRIAHLLVGNGRDMPAIVDGGHSRTIDLRIENTDDELGAVASNEQFGRVYDRIAELCTEHETTLIFVNTRRLVERVAHALEKRLGEDEVVAHHGSLSKDLRLKAEQKLKSGAVRCAVATASLELGIDVGSVDLVIQLGSPRSIATLLQRVGRSGHSLGKIPKGRVFAMTRDQLAEAAVMVKAIKALTLDEIIVPTAPLDVLSQQIVAEVACGDRNEDELYALMCEAMPYEKLSREDFDGVIEMLSEGISTVRGRSRAHLHRDRIHGMLRARKGARLSALTNAGSIPDTFNYRVVTFPDETPIGSLDEDFAIESNAGDIFLLGNTSWQIHRVEAGRVLVHDAHGAPPSIPFWLGEAPARTRELSEELGDLRAQAQNAFEAGAEVPELAASLAEECNLPEGMADQLAAYLFASHKALGALPSKECIIAERFFDDAGGMQLILHSPFGARVNKAWGLALRKRFCRSFNQELQAAATDDGLLLSLGPVHSFELSTVFDYLRSTNARKILTQAVLDAPAFGIRWRWCATRSLAILRRNGSKMVAPQILRMRSEDLLSTVFPMQQACLENVVGDIEIPDHPLVQETMRDCLEEFMDIDGLEEVLYGIETGRIRTVCRETIEPSPLCHELVNANPYAFLDDAPLEERRTRAVSLPRVLDLDKGDSTVIEDSAIAEVRAQAAAPVRDAEELHDLLLSLHLMAANADHLRWFRDLCGRGRATAIRFSEGSREFWVAAERLPPVRELLDHEGREYSCEPELAELPFEVALEGPETTAASIVRGHLEQLGPVSLAEVAAETGLLPETCLAALGQLESEGAVLRSRYSQKARRADEEEWCDKRMLARIQRRSLAALRKEIEPVSAAILNRFLFRWQRVGQSSRLIGIDGLQQVISQLQGFECAAASWESEILSARLHDYQSQWLDNLCIGGQVAWARLSPKQTATIMPVDNAALVSPRAPSSPAKTPSKATPLTLMLREDMSWLRAPSLILSRPDSSEAAARVLATLEERGASFVPDLVKATGMTAKRVEESLWELVSSGLASADGFAGVRILTNRHKGEVASAFDRGGRRRVASSKWRNSLRKARTRDSLRSRNGALGVAAAGGRWNLLPRDEVALDAMAFARQLLARYGVVFRDLLQRESALPPWRDILHALRRLEARGEVRGGRFVAGFVGEQFAVPEAVASLRALRRESANSPTELVEVSANDPLNLVGITSSGKRVPAVLGNRVLYKDGVPIASIEAGELVLHAPLPEGARVDEKLRYHPPPHATDWPQQQSLLLS